MSLHAPPRPDIAGGKRRPSLPNLTFALVAALAWMTGAFVALRVLGWYPPRPAVSFLLVAWVPMVALGILLNRVVERSERLGTAAALAVVAFMIPTIAVATVPGLKQPRQFTIPGRPWLAVNAAPDGSFDLYLIKGDAEHLTAFGETPWNEEFAVLSPDRRHIVYPSNRYGSYDLFVMDLDAAGRAVRTRRLTADPGDESGADWSPDSSRIVYQRSEGTESDIWVIDANGGDPVRLTRSGDASGPAWSPDGAHIAFSAPGPERQSGFDIWTMDPDGSHARDALAATPTDWGPSWSPDGSRIAFTGGIAPEYDVYVSDVGGGVGEPARLLTPRSPGSDLARGWAPNGSKVLFLSTRSGTGGTFLYMMNPDGSAPQLVLRL